MSSPENSSTPSPPEERVNLVADPTVEGIGNDDLVCLYPEKAKGQYSGRWHEQHTVELDGHRHSVLVTNPFSHYSETDLYFFPGFTQTTDEPGGIGFKFHTETARRRPDSRIISISTTGIGKVGDRISDPSMATVDAMGEQRFRLAKAISRNRRIQLVGLSLGTVVKNRMVQHDLEDNSPLEISACVNYVTALVAPERVPADMLARFPAMMVPDVLRELFDRRNLLDPRRFVATVMAAGHLGLSGADIKPLVATGLSLVHGTSLNLVRNETENYKVAVISGTGCPLSQPLMWNEEVKRNPSNVSLRLIAGRGHGMAVDSVGAAAQVHRRLNQIDSAA